MENWTDVVSAFANVAMAIAAIVAAVAAIPGINAWRKEVKGRRKFELAEETLAHIYEARDAIAWIRGPMSYESELAATEKRADESDESYRLRRTYSVAHHRYSQKAELFSKLLAGKYRVAAVLGEQYKEPIDELIMSVNKVLSSAGTALIYAQQARQQAEREVFGMARAKTNYIEKLQEAEAIYWGVGGERDQVAKDVDAIVERATALYAPILSADK